MPVDTTHPEYDEKQTEWQQLRDTVKGEAAVKAKTTTYLPKPNASDTSQANADRYDAYVKRAVFVEVTGRTKNSLVGAIFRKAPQQQLPADLEYLLENADGSGQSLEQVGKQVCGELLEVGRVGLLVDYPNVEATPTREQERALNLHPNISIYQAEDIVNWRYIRHGGQTILEMVVLKEAHPDPVDEYDTDNTTDKYRVLMLQDGVYTQRLYREGDGGYELEFEVQPTDGAGNRWREIPFIIAGAEDNTGTVDNSPLYGLSAVNLAHYRNSADLEEMLYLHGQGTLFVDIGEMSKELFDEANPNGILVGSRAGHVLGRGGRAELLQLSATSHIKEAMSDKENQMVSIGARLVQPVAGNKTAEQARIEAGAESSVLSALTGNASEAIEKCLEWAAVFEGVSLEDSEGEPAIVFELNQEFWPAMLQVPLRELLEAVDANVIPREGVYNTLVRIGLIEEDWSWEDVKAMIQDDSRLSPGPEGLGDFAERLLGGGQGE